MKLTISPEILRAAVIAIKPVANKAGNASILRYATLTAEDGVLTVYATDFTVAISVRCECEVEEDGRVSVPVTELQRFLAAIAKTTKGKRKRGEQDLFLTNKGNGLKLMTHGAEFRLGGVDTAVIPTNEFPIGSAQLVLPAGPFADSLAKCSPLISTDWSRPLLNGLRLSVEGEHLKFVATDGYRAVLIHNDLPANQVVNAVRVCTGVDGENGISIPLFAVTNLEKALKKAKGTIALGATGRSVTVVVGDITITSYLIHGGFPNVDAVLPQPAPFATVDREKLLDALRTAEIIAPTKNNITTLSFDDGICTVRAIGDKGDVEKAFDVDFTGEKREDNFNVKFLIGALEAIVADTVEVEIPVETPPRFVPLSIRPGDGRRELFVIMPTRK